MKQRIALVCDGAGRPVNSVTLLAVSKTFGADDVRLALAAGQQAYGGNCVQEALAKLSELAALRPRLQWYLIRPLQSNRTRAVVEAFDWVHTVARLKIAQPLAGQRPAALPPPPILCLQAQHQPHRVLRGLFNSLRKTGLALDTPSMGMNADLEAAVAEGATVVRVGSAIFGARG